jgi:hypothetical protein
LLGAVLPLAEVEHGKVRDQMWGSAHMMCYLYL